MIKINNYVDISTIDKEAKKDFIDRHSPFIYCDSSAKKGEKFPVKVIMGKEYSHPDDFDHYISSIALYDGDTLLGETEVKAGALGNQPGQLEVTFNIVPTKKLNLKVVAYCTKHGLWTNEEKVVEVN